MAEEAVWELRGERSDTGGQGKGETHRNLGAEVLKATE